MTAPGAAFIMEVEIQCKRDGIVMKKKLWTILALLSIAAVGIGVFFLFYRQSADNAPEGLWVRITDGEIHAQCNGEDLLPGVQTSDTSGSASVKTAADASIRITYGMGMSPSCWLRTKFSPPPPPRYWSLTAARSAGRKLQPSGQAMPSLPGSAARKPSGCWTAPAKPFTGSVCKAPSRSPRTGRRFSSPRKRKLPARTFSPTAGM